MWTVPRTNEAESSTPPFQVSVATSTRCGGEWGKRCWPPEASSPNSSTSSASMIPPLEFCSCFLVLSAKNKAVKHLRPLWGLDATFIKGPWQFKLLTCVGLDANNKILLTAFAIVPTEDNQCWSWFLRCLKEAHPSLNERDNVLLSDRHSSIIARFAKQWPNGLHAFFCWHIYCNMRAKGVGKANLNMF